MARSSFANPGEQTFKNRCRSYCETCWSNGSRHKRQKTTDDCICHQGAQTEKPETNESLVEATKTCECTNTKDGWVCLECKRLQNSGWRDGTCAGEGCSNPLDEASERRKICMWCDKPLPITATRDNPHVYKQKVVDAMAREAAKRQADLEAHAQRRQRRLKMTRRELRGSTGAVDNVPEFVRSLDTVNYTQLIEYEHLVPTSQQVYNSKQGKWQYDVGFLLAFQTYCTTVPVSRSVKEATRNNENPNEKTNEEKFIEKELGAPNMRGIYTPSSVEKSAAFKQSVIGMSSAKGSSIISIQVAMHKKYGIWKSSHRYDRLIHEWKEQADAKASMMQIIQQHGLTFSNDPSPLSGVFGNDLSGLKTSPQRDMTYLMSGGPSSQCQPALHHSPSLNIRQALASGTLFPSPARENRAEAALEDYDFAFDDQSLSRGKLNIQSLRDCSAKRAALQKNVPTSQEELDKILEMQETLRGEQNAIPGSVDEPGPSRNVDVEMPDAPQTNPEELDRLIAAQEALREQYIRAFDTPLNGQGTDEDDLDLMIALQQSAMQAAETGKNDSRPDGRPPVYFA